MYVKGIVVAVDFYSSFSSSCHPSPRLDKLSPKNVNNIFVLVLFVYIDFYYVYCMYIIFIIIQRVQSTIWRQRQKGLTEILLVINI